MRVLVWTLAALFTQSAASAAVLWRDVPAGATVEQVRAAIPDAVEVESPSVLGDGDTTGLLEVSGFQVGDVDFEATLYFRDQALDRVFIKPVVRPSGEDAIDLLNKLRDGLTAKYGAAVVSDDSVGSFSIGYEATWRSDGVLIRLIFNKYGESSPAFVQVNYIASRDASNL